MNIEQLQKRYDAVLKLWEEENRKMFDKGLHESHQAWITGYWRGYSSAVGRILQGEKDKENGTR